MMQQEDRHKILSAFGGTKGLIDSGLPTLLFLVVFNIKHDLTKAILSSLVLSALITMVRLVKRTTIQHAVSGFIGALICAAVAHKTGNAADLYLPKLAINLFYGSLYLVANLVGWPVMGLVLGPILGEMFHWRNDPPRAAVYKRAGWLWVAMFFTRIAVQYPIYKSGNVNLLGTVNLAMGYPLFIATGYATWLVIKTVPVTINPEK